MKFLLDKEVDLKKEDLLNTLSYSETLKDVILDSPNTSAFTIGLFGEWGSGKSSIIKTATEELTTSATQKIKFIVYDAWKYANDSFRRTFLLKLQEDLKFEKTELFDSFYKNKNSDVKVDKKTNWTFLIITGLIFLVSLIVVNNLNDLDDKAIAGIVGAFAGIAVNIWGNTFVDYKVTVQEPMFFAPEQFEECFDEMITTCLQPKTVLGSIKKFIKGENYIDGLDKIVLVIDNIDRCPKELAYELLTNIKNFLKEKKNLIFLIPVDDDALKRHIMRGGTNTHKEADEFLRKFFNVTLRIKPFKRFDLYEFSCQINNKHQLNLSPTTLDIISKEYATNPRRIIQFFNNLISEIHVFSIKYGPEFVKRNESLICKLLIIREEWPEYYKKLSQDPNLLNNPGNTAKIEIETNHRDLNDFLNVTHSVNFDTPYETIEVLFSLRDRNLGIPAIALEAITKKDTEALEKLLKEEVIQKRTLIDDLIERIDVGLKRGLYQTEVNNLLEVVCRINKHDPLTKDENRRIYDEIAASLPRIISYMSDLDILCDYSAKVEQDGFNYIEKHITEFIRIVITNAQNENDYPLAKRLFMAYVRSSKRISELGALSNVFTKDYERRTDKVEQFNFSKEALKELIEDDLVTYIIKQIKEFSEKDRYYEDLLYVSRVISFTENAIFEICNKINEIYPTLNSVEKEFITSTMNEFSQLFSNSDCFVSEPAKVEALNTLYTKFSTVRTYGGSNKNILDELINETERKISLDFIISIFKLSREKIDIKPSMQKIINNSTSINPIFEALIQLKRTEKFSLLSLREIILSSTAHTQEHLELLEHLFLFKEGDNFLLEENIVDEKLAVLLRVMIDTQNVDLIAFLEKWAEAERLTKLLTGIIENLSKDDIIRLPQKLCFLAFDKIAQGDNIFQYEDNIDLLKAIATKGSPDHISKLLRVIKAKLQRDEKVDGALDVLEEIELLTDNQIMAIKGDIENINSAELKEEAKGIVLNKSTKEINYSKKGLIILKAKYSSDRNRVERNITRKVRKKVADNKLAFTITNELVDSKDPDPGHPKDFKLEYVYNGERLGLTLKEGESIAIP